MPQKLTTRFKIFLAAAVFIVGAVVIGLAGFYSGMRDADAKPTAGSRLLDAYTDRAMSAAADKK